MKSYKLRILTKIMMSLLGGVLITSCQTNKSDHKRLKKKTALRLLPDEGNPRNSEGDFITLTDGKILFVYSHFTGGTGDNAKAHLAGRYSSDNGSTWTQEDVTILSNEGKMNTMSVSLLRLKNGDIAILYLRKDSEKMCIPYLRTSNDEAKSWSDPVRCIDIDGYYVVNNNRLIQLQNNRIIFPASRHDNNNLGIVRCYFSDDDGNTWSRSAQVANPDSIILQEPGIVELKDSKLLLFCRTNSGVQYFSYSSDRGETWTPIQPGNIKSPLSPASIKRIPSTGDLLLVWNNNYEPVRDGGDRTPLNTAISKDDGKTWDKIKTVEGDPEGWYCYTAIEFVGNDVLLGHCAGDTRTNSGLSTTNITKLSLDWIYGDVTPAPYVEEDNDGLVKLACSDKNAEIRYTLDGSLPSRESGFLYTAPIKVSHITPLYMQAFSEGKTQSSIVFSHIGTNVWQPAPKVTGTPMPGLHFRYYENKINNSEEIEAFTPLKSGVADVISIKSAQQSENFAFIFDGFIKVPDDDTYNFYLTSNDGSVLILDNYLLINNDGAHGSMTKDVNVALRKGMHKIKVKYFQLGGGSSLNLQWSSSKISKQEVAAGYLFH